MAGRREIYVSVASWLVWSMFRVDDVVVKSVLHFDREVMVSFTCIAYVQCPCPIAAERATRSLPARYHSTLAGTRPPVLHGSVRRGCNRNKPNLYCSDSDVLACTEFSSIKRL